jgi:hypothetical protein
VPGQHLLRDVHGAGGRGRRGQGDLAARVGLREREEAAVFDDLLRDEVVALRELREGDGLAALEPREEGVIAHEHALRDVVAGMDGREGGGDGDADAGPLLGLHRRLPAGADALAVAGDDDLEPARHERPFRKEALLVHGDSGIGVACDVLRPVVEAGPGRRHGVGVDVVHEVLDPQVLHAEVEIAAQLAADELGVLGQEEDALAGGQ